MKKIRHLRKALPEYELAHEKAVFKAAAIVADTKYIVKNIDVNVRYNLKSYDLFRKNCTLCNCLLKVYLETYWTRALFLKLVFYHECTCKFSRLYQSYVHYKSQTLKLRI